MWYKVGGMRNYSRGGGLRGRAGMRFKPIPKVEEFYRPMRVVVKRVSKHRNSIWGDYENGTSLARTFREHRVREWAGKR